MRLYLTRPTLEDENEMLKLIAEYNQSVIETLGIDKFEGIREISHIENWNEWIVKMDRIRYRENVPYYLVPSTFYLAKNKIDGKIIGGITLRQ